MQLSIPQAKATAVVVDSAVDVVVTGLPRQASPRWRNCSGGAPMDPTVSQDLWKGY